MSTSNVSITDADQILSESGAGLLGLRHVVTMADLLWLANASDSTSCRYALGSIAINPRRIAATDGRRLHTLSIDEAGDDWDRTYLIPVDAIKAIGALCRRAENVTISCYDNGRIFLSAAGSHVMVREVEGHFPSLSSYDGRIDDAMNCITTAAVARKACKDSPAMVALFGKSLDASMVVDAIRPLAAKDMIPYVDNGIDSYVTLFVGEGRQAVILPCTKD